MKKPLIAFCILLISPIANAQSTDDIDLIQSLWGMEKRAIIEEYMDLSAEEETSFWAEYEAYETSRKELGKDRITIINEYVENYGSLSDEKATELMNEVIANNIAIQKLAKKTFKKLSKSISPVKAAQFIQLENYFVTSIQLYLQENLPFIGELEDLIDE
jgi:hypothetical protein